MVRHGFANPRLPAFSSAHFVDNLASARVLAKLGFEPVGRGRIACAARRHDVEVVTYWLDRQHALMGEPQLGIADRPPAGTLARLARPVRRPLRSVHGRGQPHANTLLTRDTFEARAR